MKPFENINKAFDQQMQIGRQVNKQNVAVANNIQRTAESNERLEYENKKLNAQVETLNKQVDELLATQQSQRDEIIRLKSMIEENAKNTSKDILIDRLIAIGSLLIALVSLLGSLLPRLLGL